MTLDELQEWILSEAGLKAELSLLARFAAARSIGLQEADLDSGLAQYVPDWRRLVFAGSVLSRPGNAHANEAALMIAHAGLLFSGRPVVADASAIVLGQLANHRAIQLAEARGVLNHGIIQRVGVTEKILSVRRELAQSLYLHSSATIRANHFQRQFWDDLERASWVSASAPTASGKTYLVLQWLLNEFATAGSRLAVFLAPTRALVGEIERELIELSDCHQIPGLRVASLPLAELADLTRPTILVFTQERLHAFLNALDEIPQVDIAIVDEVHKLSDGLRGVILQDAIERIARSNASARLIFLSPLTDNPETLLSDAPPNLPTAVVPSDMPTVSQNLLIAEQQPRDSRTWHLQLKSGELPENLGVFRLHARPDGERKRLSYVALSLGRQQTGTLVYANGAAEAEEIAWQIFDGLESEYTEGAVVPDDLKELSDFARDTVPPQFQLVELLKRGIAFHYGNMPTLLRSEIERLFRSGAIRFLVCTSTLIEGVNLACRTIVIRGPRKGNNRHMGAHDFWNLAGRAGRWGQDFHGNIVCVDVNRPSLWPQGAPHRARYPIKRETDVVLERQEEMLQYLADRPDLQTSDIKPQLEQVSAYLLAWQAREGSFLSAPSAARLPHEYAQKLQDALAALAASIDIPSSIISRHPGVSGIALQSLLNYFRTRPGSVEELLPATPESDDAYQQFIAIFKRINSHLYQAFLPSAAIPLHALVTVEWMRGLPLGRIIQNRIVYLQQRNRPHRIAAVIRDTMRDVEDIARFRAPKYLAAYLDVLKFYLEEIDRADLLPENLKFDLYLEFGVATTTLLSLIGLGLSRTSAIALNDFIAADDLDEAAVWQRLIARRWELLDIPAVVKNEIRRLVERRELLRA